MGSTIDTAIIGIGLNINQIKFTSNAPNPISLAQIVGHEVNKEVVLQDLIENIDRWYTLLKNEQLKAIDHAYLSVLYKMGIIANYRDEDGDFEGTIIGINSIGQLIIQKANNSRKEYHFKEVEYLHE